MHQKKSLAKIPHEANSWCPIEHKKGAHCYTGALYCYECGFIFPIAEAYVTSFSFINSSVLRINCRIIGQNYRKSPSVSKSHLFSMKFAYISSLKLLVLTD